MYQVGSKLHDYIEEINMLYPPEIVQCPAFVVGGLRHRHLESNRVGQFIVFKTTG